MLKLIVFCLVCEPLQIMLTYVLAILLWALLSGLYEFIPFPLQTYLSVFRWIRLVCCAFLTNIECTSSFTLILICGGVGSIGDTSESVLDCFCELINIGNNYLCICQPQKNILSLKCAIGNFLKFQPFFIFHNPLN